MSKVLFVSVMGRDCTLNGVTSGKSGVYLDMDDHQDIYSCPSGTPDLVLIVNKNPQGVSRGDLVVHSKTREVHSVYAAPYVYGVVRTEGGMFGGHYIITSDSRFPYESPIPVHDRFEW